MVNFRLDEQSLMDCFSAGQFQIRLSRKKCGCILIVTFILDSFIYLTSVCDKIERFVKLRQIVSLSGNLCDKLVRRHPTDNRFSNDSSKPGDSLMKTFYKDTMTGKPSIFFSNVNVHLIRLRNKIRKTLKTIDKKILSSFSNS